MGNAAHSNIGRSICTVCISGDFPFLVLLFKTHAFCHRRLVYFPQCTRTSFQSNQGTLYPKEKWKQILLNEMEYLLWIYAWFYLAWGLNYSQKDFYGRTNIPYTAYTPEIFQSFVDNYIDKLNASYTDVTSIDEPLVCRESVHGYNQISDTLGIHRPPHSSPRVKTMLSLRSFPWSVLREAWDLSSANSR